MTEESFAEALASLPVCVGIVGLDSPMVCISEKHHLK